MVSFGSLKNNRELNEADALAFNVKNVKNDKQLQSFLHEALQNGKYIYIYGETKRMEFKDLLNLETIKVPLNVNGEKVYADFSSKAEEIKEKGPRKSKDTGLNVKDTISIIGYTINKNSPLQYSQININSYDSKGKKRENTIEVYMQEIINQQSKIIDINKKETGQTSLIKKDYALAGSSRVDSNYGFTGAVYSPNDQLWGRIETDYILYKANSDGSSNYDFFSVKPMTQIVEFNGAQSRELKTDIDIPYDVDHLEDWSPYNDETGRTFSIQLVYPFSISWGMTWDDKVDINDISSRYYDYARWIVTDGDLNRQDFRPGAGWASSGTFAVADVRNWGRFAVGPSHQYPVEAYNHVHITYDY